MFYYLGISLMNYMIVLIAINPENIAARSILKVISNLSDLSDLLSL